MNTNTEDTSSSPLSEKEIKSLAQLLVERMHQEIYDNRYANVKTILKLLGTGLAISAVFIAPKAASSLLTLLKENNDWENWKHFNLGYLRQTLRRLEKQKLYSMLLRS